MEMIDDKTGLKAPCGYPGMNRQGQRITKYAEVNCGHNCEKCGWNPKEQKRRLETGYWIKTNTRVNAETGETIELTKSVKKLIFKGG